MNSSNAKVVIVTGGTFGIGQATTLLLASRGWQVVACGLDTLQPGSIAEGGSEMTNQLLAERGLVADILECDVSSVSDVSRLVDSVLTRFCRIDGLVNNAAIHPRGTILETSEETFDRVVAVNLRGMFLVTKQVLPHMIARGGGAIVNVGSGSGWGKPDLLAYSASKGGVHAFTMALAYDHLHQHIRVNCVIPGGTISGMTTGIHQGAGFSRAAAKTVTGTHNKPDDIAMACAFLLSNEARQISGTFLDVGCFAHQGGPIPSRT